MVSEEREPLREREKMPVEEKRSLKSGRTAARWSRELWLDTARNRPFYTPRWRVLCKKKEEVLKQFLVTFSKKSGGEKEEEKEKRSSTHKLTADHLL